MASLSPDEEKPLPLVDAGIDFPTYSKRQLRLIERLHDKSPELSAMLQGAIVAFSQETNPDRLAQVAHSIRELMENFPRFCDLEIRQHTKTSDHIAKLVELFGQYKQARTKDDTNAQADYALMNFLETFDEFVNRKSKDKSTKEIAQKTFGILDGSGNLPVDTAEWLARKWVSLNRYFLAVSHHGKVTSDDELFRYLDELESFLCDRLEPPVFLFQNQIDELLNQPPTDTVVERAVDLMHKCTATNQYFWKSLNRADWLPVLEKKNCFKLPPSVVRDDDGCAVGCAWWPQADYLKRMVSENPKDALEIITRVHTDNHFVMLNFFEVCDAVPDENLLNYAKYLQCWLSRKDVSIDFLLEEAARSALTLATKGYTRIASKMFAAILDVDPDNQNHEEAESSLWSKKSPVLRFNQIYLRSLLEDPIPAFIHLCPSEALSVFCGLLDKYVAYSVEEPGKKPYDGSVFFRPAVEDHEQNHDFETITYFVAAVRDAADACCRTDKHRIPDVIRQLESYGWDIFRRIALHLLRVVEEVPAELFRERLVSRANLEYYAIHHEYSLLLKAKYGDLSKADQQQILAWTQEAYEEEKHKVDTDPELTPQQRDTRMKYWLHRRLLILSDHLTGEWADRLADLNTELGDPEMPPEFLTWSGGGFVEQKSPADLPVLSSMSVSDLVRFLKEWTPTGDWRGPTPSGLGDALQKTVEADYTKYLSDIAQFEDIEIPPIYVRHFIAAFRKISLSLSDSQLTQLLALCEWVSKIPSDQPAPSAVGRLPRGLDFDSDWSHARRELANLMEALFPNDVTFPQQYKDTAWEIIRTLTEDPEPTLEAENNESNFDDYTRLINSIRGIALNAMMRYAMWVCRNIKNTENRKATLADIPEVTQVLEDHLNSSRPFGNNRTDRALYGHWLPQLVSMDDEWVSRHVDAIFPNGIERRHLRWAAWESYLAYSQHVYRIVIDKIRHIYIEETEELRERQYEKDEPIAVDRRLAEHVLLIWLFQGESTIQNPLLSKFFEYALPALTAHAMEYLGQQLHDNTEMYIDKAALLQEFWVWRLESAGGYDNLSEKELSSFGWWFASGIFDERWGYDQLQEVLSRAANSRASVEMFEHISEIFERYPAESLRCVRLFINHSADQWFFYSSRRRKGVWTILEQGLASQDTDIRDEAESLVHLLGLKGRLKFRELLTQPRIDEV